MRCIIYAWMVVGSESARSFLFDTDDACPMLRNPLLISWIGMMMTMAIMMTDDDDDDNGDNFTPTAG